MKTKGITNRGGRKEETIQKKATPKTFKKKLFEHCKSLLMMVRPIVVKIFNLLVF
jgi:hypothetical protein